jgi:hypothetical protein
MEKIIEQQFYDWKMKDLAKGKRQHVISTGGRNLAPIPFRGIFK